MKSLRRYSAYIIMAVTLFYIVFNIYQSWPELKQFFIERPDKRIILSFIPAIINSLIAAWGVKRLLDSRMFKLTLSRAYLAYYLPQYGKYIPGKIWSLIMAWSLSKRLQMTVAQVVFVTVFNVLFATVFNVALSALVLSVFLGQYRVPFLFIGVITIISWCFFPWYFQIFEKLVRRFIKYDVSLKLGYYRFLQVTGILLLSWIVFLVGYAFLLIGFGVNNIPDILKVSASSSIGWLAGFYALIIPGGIGVREVTSYFILSQMFSKDIALAIPILSRIWMSIYELLIFTICGILYCLEGLRLSKQKGETNPQKCPDF